MEWKNTDPRYDINKRAIIVVLRKTIDGDTACIANVNTKDGWDIFTIKGDLSLGVDDDWDPCWYWTWYPTILAYGFKS